MSTKRYPVYFFLVFFLIALTMSSCAGNRRNKKCDCPTWDHIDLSNSATQNSLEKFD
ncbi:hypothetical protein [Halocola ammonii]